MGLFSKLLNGDASGALNALKDAAQKAVNEAADKLNQAQNAAQNNASPAPASAPAPRSDGPSGFSWGPDMPAEENQYNFSGNYIRYFETVFREDFPEYSVAMAPGSDERSPVFNFFSGGRKALVVELKSQSSSAQRIRRAAEAEGVPYLRFYYNHDGWWNTRKYVVTRVRAALQG